MIPPGGGMPSGGGISTPPTHSMIIGYMFWFFGFTGARRFYYGRPLSGVIWLLTFGLLGIGWIIDALLIPGMNDVVTATSVIEFSKRLLTYDALGDKNVTRETSQSGGQGELSASSA